MKFYLRMKAVNLAYFVYDTQNLHTIRGGGLLLLKAPERVAKRHPELSVETTGASSGLYSFEAKDLQEAETIRLKVAEFLQTDPELRHATFVVDVLASSGDFQRDLEALSARNRWRQWRQLTQAVPAPEAAGTKICEIDRLRPSVAEERVKGELKAVSESVRVRLNYGRQQKRKFYEQETKLRDLPEFVRHFEELASERQQGNLHRKMAVIYIDGNSFGAIRGLCESEQEVKSFGEKVSRLHRDALKTLLQKMLMDTGFWNQDRLRIETLLWGGDEFIWVVPAWRGWSVLEGFFKSVKDAVFEVGAGSVALPLTYSAGLVFCHHNAPIHRIVDLAKEELAKSAKSSNRKDAGDKSADLATRLSSYQNVFEFLVLESFDHVGSLQEYRRKRCPVPWSATLAGDQMGKAAKDIRELKKRLPQGQVVGAAYAAVGSPLAARSPAEFQLRLRELQDSEIYWELAELEPFLGKEGLWIQLADLWNYISEDTP